VLLSRGDSFPHLIQKRRSQLGFVTYLLNSAKKQSRNHSIHSLLLQKFKKNESVSVLWWNVGRWTYHGRREDTLIFSNQTHVLRRSSTVRNFSILHCVVADRSTTAVKVLRYKSEGHLFDSRWPMEFFIDNPSDRTMALGSTEPLTEMSTRSTSWGQRRPVRKADNLTTSLGTLTSWNPLGTSGL